MASRKSSRLSAESISRQSGMASYGPVPKNTHSSRDFSSSDTASSTSQGKAPSPTSVMQKMSTMLTRGHTASTGEGLRRETMARCSRARSTE